MPTRTQITPTERFYRDKLTYFLRDYPPGMFDQDSGWRSAGVYHSARKSIVYTNLPNYRSLRKSGLPLPDNDYSQNGHAGSAGMSYAQRWEPHWNGIALRERWDSNMFRLDDRQNGGGWPSFPMHLRNAAVSDVISKAKGNQFTAPVFVAEGRQAVAMVTARAQNLVYLIRALRRGRFDIFLNNLVKVDPSSPKNRRRQKLYETQFGRSPRLAAANAWLEYSYGWTPLMSDVRNAVMATMDAVESERGRIGRVSAQRVLRQTTSRDFIASVSPPFRGRVNEDFEFSYRIVWAYQAKPADLPGRFGLTNPLEVAWELVPFSFVADWFLPIGDYLSALDTPFRFTHKGGTEGYRTSLRQSGELTSADGYWAERSGSFSSSVYNVQRQKLSSVPAPRLLDYSFDPLLNARRAISSIALLTQQIHLLSRR